MSDLSAVKEKIIDILKIYNINKIIYVDDNIPEIGVEDVITSERRDLIIKKYFSKILSDDEDIIKNELKKQWENIADKEKMEIKELVKNNIISEIDKEAIPAFMKLVPENMRISLSPESWEREKNKLLVDCNTSLFLFDQDLNIEGRKEAGIEIIRSITMNNEIICGLFTHLSTKEKCVQYREEMCRGHEIAEDKFFVIPKECANDDDKSLFVYFLKLTVLTKDYSVFKKCIYDKIENINKSVKNKINEIMIEDFDHIIFQVPKREGMWEPDMLFGIHFGFQRREFINSTYSDKNIKTIISRIRSVSNISTDNTSFLVPQKAWEIQHNELYDNEEHLNKNHLPIDIGDIFEKTGQGNAKTYILLHQPCDLMVRPNGKRERSSERLTLLEMKKTKVENNIYQQEVWYYSSEANENWVVNFKDIFMVKGCILDLCTYNEDGISRFFPINKEDNSVLRPSMIERHKRITKMVNKIKRDGEKILASLTNKTTTEYENIEKKTYDTLFSDDLFKAEYKQNEDGFIIKYNCKRIARLSYERAVGLLAGFYSVMSRPAYPPDYGQGK
ncbi:MAG: hypothetical protein LBI03_10735 [Clostridiales bacterium]|jgi:hypothetical protein|nr:hypothetical protein [Clostridiales bacterium]